LDIGCGQVPYIKYITENDYVNYIGIDPNKKDIQNNQKNYLSPKLKFKAVPIENAKLPEGYFDSVLLIGSYDHVDDLDLTLKKIKNALKNKGIVIIMESSCIFFEIILVFFIFRCSLDTTFWITHQLPVFIDMISFKQR